MKAVISAGCLAALFTTSFLSAQEFPEQPKPTKEHERLQQFVGEWESESEASIPGQEAMKCTGTIKARALGGFWVVAEQKSNMPGFAVEAVQTLGYDPKAKKFVGTWVDSMMNHMWKYEGTVDKEGKKLTLEAEGPNFTAEGTAKYRDMYEFKSKDHIIISSAMQGPDGKWVPFMTGSAKRKK